MASARTAAPKVPLLDVAGKASKQVSLDGTIFGAETKAHLVHETVRLELNVRRAGTRGAKSRGMVSGGRAKPWRQKGTGRARIGTTRAPHWTGGGVAFPPTMRSFAFKVNRKERRAALRGALTAHVDDGTLALFDGSSFDQPSTRAAAELIATWSKELPLVVVLAEDEVSAAKSFRNLAARRRHVARGARGRRDRLGPLVACLRAGAAGRRGARRKGKGGIGVSLHPNEVLISPIVSEKSYSLIADRKYTFRVHQNAHKTQIRQAVEQLFDVHVTAVNVLEGAAEGEAPRATTKGYRPGYKKAIVQVREGETIPIFEGAQV